MDGKPGRATIRLLNEVAELSVGLKRLGLGDDAITRCARAYAEARLRHAAHVRPVPVEPNYGWRDGVWTDLDLPEPGTAEDEEGSDGRPGDRAPDP